MKQLVLASFASALIGGASGTALVLWMMRSESASAPATDVPAAHARRLEVVERALVALERRMHVSPTALASAEDAPVADDVAAAANVATVADPEAAITSPHVDGPVFEAAVLDVIDRAKETRDSERAAERDERRRQRDQYWVHDLTMRLGLTPAQTERLHAIQAQLSTELEQERRPSSDGSFTPRDKRRAARQAIRRRAEDQLRGVLAPRQQAAYAELDDKLKLYRSKDDN